MIDIEKENDRKIRKFLVSAIKEIFLVLTGILWGATVVLIFHHKEALGVLIETVGISNSIAILAGGIIAYILSKVTHVNHEKKK